ncbi:glycosyltransferase [Acidianus sulfidivorans JP7]|uniref:Glycosyl transferase family 2 n=1 Tax=Acidianus sulfidivorans JP7 TaxID=619593 RepID=A0A2U9IL54_9CREN|nr:glycosyltransferase family 2 protein [Acidianus sulfidivorans]AWR96654.1 glycosyltransferase [Acidianus sulfidivorans JP7]
MFFISQLFSIILVLSSIISSFWLLLQVYYLKSIKNNYVIKPKNISEHPFFSIIVAIKNEDIQIVKELIDNVGSLNYDNYEVLIVSDDSQDYVNNLIKYCRDKDLNNFRIVRREKPTGRKAGALNYGSRLANGKYLIFLDSEARVSKDFINNVCKYLDYEPLALRLEVRNPENFIERIYYFTTQFAMRSLFLSRYQKGLYIFPNGSAIVISKNTLNNIGFWKEGIVTEDLELGIRAVLKNKKFTFINDVVVSILSPKTLADLYYQIERWAYGSGELFFYGLKLFLKGIRGIEGYIYVIQWGIYSIFIFTLIIISSLQIVLNVPLSVYFASIFIFALALSIYSLLFKINEKNLYLASFATMWASIIGFTKGFFKTRFTWKVTPKVNKNSSIKATSLNILQYIIFFISIINLENSELFPSFILLLLSISIFLL